MCFHDNQHPWAIKYLIISLYSQYQPPNFICLPVMNSPIFPSLDDIYCILLKKFLILTQSQSTRISPNWRSRTEQRWVLTVSLCVSNYARKVCYTWRDILMIRETDCLNFGHNCQSSFFEHVLIVYELTVTKKKQVTQGQNVVSNTRCLALHGCKFEWEAGQRPQRG